MRSGGQSGRENIFYMRLICPICQSRKTQIIQKGVWDSVRRNVYQCEKCQTTFLHPVMTKKESERFYSQQGEKARLKRIPGKKAKQFLENKQKKEAIRRAMMLKKYLRPSQILCEIGASGGHWLELAKGLVKKVVAIEPGEVEQKKLKTKKIDYYSWLEDLPANLKFDAVAMFHLFEHIAEPRQYLRNLKKHLNKKALVIVELPNVDDALVSRYQVEKFKKFYFQSMHCFYYNEKTLANVFKKAGFKLIKCHYIQRYPFSNHLQWLLNGKAGGNKEYEQNFGSINKTYTDLLIRERATDTIVCIFRKIV